MQMANKWMQREIEKMPRTSENMQMSIDRI
jgi:hypothetical protein